MPTRNKRLLSAAQTEEVLTALQGGRRGAVIVCREARIGSDQYKAAQSVLEAVDALAESLGCDRDLFHEKGYRP